MKLVKQTSQSRQYFLNQNEAEILRGLLQKFPFTGIDPVEISRTDQKREAVERRKLLNEALAEHRKELKQAAVSLLAAGQFKQSEKGGWLTLNMESREKLLQILNDIRVGSWRALGEPENLESPATHSSLKERAIRNLMDLAGYFEHHLLEAETETGKQ